MKLRKQSQNKVDELIFDIVFYKNSNTCGICMIFHYNFNEKNTKKNEQIN